jgi:hypothetical protein
MTWIMQELNDYYICFPLLAALVAGSQASQMLLKIYHTDYSCYVYFSPGDKVFPENADT